MTKSTYPPKVILKVTEFDGHSVWVIFDHITHWEPRGDGARVWLSNGKCLAIKETCEELEKHIERLNKMFAEWQTGIVLP